MSIPGTHAADERETFLRMASEFPVRTGIFTFGLPAFALLQLVNGLVHDGSLPYIGLFSVLVTAYSVLITRYHVAAYRRETMSRDLASDW
ncbi:hypothetical protein [Halorarum salinum]|uniref:Uncharacterized protein n=1 Tax=Halorarum salinum TaxID=2743089 RepID=A0A7D5QCL9_9EURY|nr:hypothetical protein [Halobaculum salinum]QLG64296.1 hypothetical protein HUG12_21185 [Halobaculum salinum]